MAMNSECLLPYYTAQSGSGVGMFNTSMGKLQRQLYKGEYDIFKYAPIFESDFIQITKRGEVIDVHNRVRMVTVGIACTSPILPLPDVMLLARPATTCEDLSRRGQATKGKSRKAAKALELTRLLPLKFVRISVHNHEKQQLRLKFATGRSCYLQLCPPLDAREDLFAYWEKLIYLLRPPVDSNSSTYAIPAEDTIGMPVFEEEDRTSLTDFQGKGDQDQVSVRSLNVVPEVCGATSAAYAGGEGIHLDGDKATAMSGAPTPTISKELAKEPAKEVAGPATGSVASTLAMAAKKSSSGSIAGVAPKRAGRSKPHMAITKSPKRTKDTIPAAASRSLENISNASSCLSPGDNIKATITGEEPTSLTVGEAAKNPEEEKFTSTLTINLDGEQQVSPDPVEVRKGRRERRERREKDRSVGRSSHHRKAGESRRKTMGDKVARKSGRRRIRSDKKEKHRSSPRGSRHGSIHTGISHGPITKESRTSHKSGRSLSTASSASGSKRISRISSFLRNVRANLSTKAGTSPRGRDAGILTKAMERTNMETIIEAAESGQGLEIVGSMKSETVETVTIAAH